MKNRILFVLLISFIAFISNVFGNELTIKAKLKKETLLMPMKIIISNENIYILDRGDDSVKVFNRDAKFVKSFGKKGEGPGEFSCAGDFCIYKDKVYIIDTCKSKIEIFSAQHGNHLESKKINVSNPFRIAVDNGKIFISSLVFIKGQKIITTLVEEKDLKVTNSFLDCIPIKGMDLSNIYKNAGFLTTGKGKVYFAFALSNKVLEFTEDGKLLKEYLLPLKPIDNPVIDRKGSNMLLKDSLNYDIRAKGGRIYLLSRDERRNSLIFELVNGRFIEKFKIEESLINFDIAEDIICGIEEEEGEVLIYKLKK